MARQGCALQEAEVQKIVRLLATTDMTIGEIAQRYACSRSAIVSINRKFEVRQYAGFRSSWTVLANVGGQDPETR